MPRRPETWVSLCNLMLKLCDISRSSAILGSDSPQSNNRKDNSLWVTSFIPREKPNVKRHIAGYLRLPQLSPVERRNQGTPLQSVRRLWPDTRRLQLPLDDCCRLVLPYHAIQHATDGTVTSPMQQYICVIRQYHQARLIIV